MADRYQWAQTDGHLDWHAGFKGYDNFWDVVHDRLRFHKGEKFRIIDRPSGHENPLRTLAEMKDALHERLDHEKADSLFNVRAESDHYALTVRRHVVQDDGERVVAAAHSYLGTPYVFGATDCSWLSRASYQGETDTSDWVHNAHAQHEMFKSKAGYYIIGRDKIRPGDLLWFHNDDHVGVYLDGVDGGRVWDTEPHGTSGPSGWGYISPGVRIRPMSGGYYCAWGNVNGIGRVAEVNGKP